MKIFNGTPRALACAAWVALSVLGCGGSDSSGPGTGDKSVTIKRDTYGVPHIYAHTVRGLFHGYGYAVAEDRLFQMEMAKRSVLGTASEVMGASYVALDTNARRINNPESIRAQIAKLSQNDLDILEGYASGFNARIQEVLEQRQQWLPKQFTDAGFDPTPWTAYDVAMVWIGTMANVFSNSNSEVSNLQLLNQLQAAKGNALGMQLFDQLRWLEDVRSPTTVPRPAGYAEVEMVASVPSTPSTTSATAVRSLASSASTLSNTSPKTPGKHTVACADVRTGASSPPLAASTCMGAQQRAQLASVSDTVLVAHNDLAAAWQGIATPDQRPKASNLWIVGAQKTTDGSTVLVNGPQFGFYNPSYVYGVGLHGAGFDLTGNTPFAYPVVLFGTNGSIAWGATAGPLDVNDMYQIKLHPDNPREYWYQGSYRPMTQRIETIKVKGEADRTVEVYSTVHGLVTSVDTPNKTAYALRRSWEGYELESMLGWIHSTRAKNWSEWLAQAQRVAITINWYYADAKGNMGYVSPGRLPVRPPQQDVRLPALGDGSMEWLGFRPFSEVPQVYNPAQGYVVNWNNQSTPGVRADGGNHSIVDRVNEIIRRIEAKPRLSPDEVWGINQQTSMADTNARYFVPYIVHATRALPSSDPVRKAAQMLSDWSGLNTNPNQSKNYAEPAATLMRTWLPLVYQRVLADDLPTEVMARYTSANYPAADASRTPGSVIPGQASKLLYNALLGSKAGVPQTFDFFNGADKHTVIRETFAQAVTQLSTQLGSDMSQWLTPVVPHRFGVRNILGFAQANANEELELPTYMNRGTQNNKVVFASDGSVTLCTVAPPGQSGFVAPNGTPAKHYDDQLKLYKDFECKSEWLTSKDVDAHLESSKTLKY